MDIDKQIKEQIIMHFSKVKFCISSCVALLKHKQHIKRQLQKILYKIPQYLSTYKIVEYLLLDKQLEKCENCGQYLTALQMKAFEQRGGYRYCHTCNKLPQIRRKIRLNALPKYKATMKARYGVEFSVYSKEIEEKRKDTCRKKYGSDYNITSDNAKEKIKKTNLKKYNVENHAKLPKIQLYQDIQQYIIPLFSLQQFLSDANIQKIKRKWQCKKCGNVFEAHLHKTMHIPQIPYLPRCLNCYPLINGYSNKEKQLVNFCKQYFPELKQNVRDFINPKEVDILIPQIKLAIEFNGLWYHSIQSGTELGYHLMKTEKCEEKGYRLIHIWQNDWDVHKEEIKEKLIEIFENREIIDITNRLDRCWYSTLQFQKYQLLPPEIVTKQIYSIENCGYIIVNKD